MYNEEIKQRYLEQANEDYSKGTITQICETFKAIGPYEEKLGKDISEFSEQEILIMFQSMRYSAMTLYKICSLSERYCIARTGTANGFANITHDTIRKVADVKGLEDLTYSHILEWTDQLINPSDKFFLYGLFCGIRGKDMTELTCSSIKYADRNTNTLWLAALNTDGSVNFKNRSITVDDKLFKYAVESSQSEYYIQVTRTGVKKKVYYRPSSDQLIIKAIMAGPQTEETYSRYVNRAKQKFNKIKNQIGIKCTPLDIQWTGCAYYLKKAALEEGLEIFSEYDFLKLKALPQISKQFDKIIDRDFIRETLKRYV